MWFCTAICVVEATSAATPSAADRTPYTITAVVSSAKGIAISTSNAATTSMARSMTVQTLKATMYILNVGAKEIMKNV